MFLNDNVFDSGLSYLTTNGAVLHITSQEATTYTEATSTYTLGNSSITVGSPVNGDIDGRKVVVGAITGGTVTGTGTASHFAVVDATSTLLATGSLTTSQAVTSGNTFTLDAIDVTLRDPA